VTYMRVNVIAIRCKTAKQTLNASWREATP
jgi:hypothetical protein